MKLWVKHLRAVWFLSDKRQNTPKARFVPQLEQLESRETPNSLYNPLFGSVFLSLDPLDVPYSTVSGDGSTSGTSSQGDGSGGSTGGTGSTQGDSGGGTGSTQPPSDNFSAADPAVSASTIDTNAGLFDSALNTDNAAFAALVAAAIGGQGQSGGTSGVGAAVVIGLATPAAPPTSPATPQNATAGPAPALAPPAGTTGIIGQGLSPSEFGLNPFTLRGSGATISALTPFAVSSSMTVPAAASGGAAVTTAGTDANGIGFTTTTIDSYSFAASLAPDAAGGSTYEETYSFSYDVQTVPAATGGASVHDWGASGYTFLANNDGGN